jgi:pseudoazurin
MTKMKPVALTFVSALFAMSCGMASAAEIEVRMLNQGADSTMVFEPAFVKIAPGDKIRFIPTDRGHNVESIDGMVPAGAASFGNTNNEELTVTFDVPGVYGVKCKLHYGMGMVALITVGDPKNVAQAEAVSHPGKAKKVFSALFGQITTTTASK